MKWSCEPARAEDVPTAIRRALFTALQPPRHPLLIVGAAVARDAAWQEVIQPGERHQAPVWA